MLYIDIQNVKTYLHKHIEILRFINIKTRKRVGI